MRFREHCRKVEAKNISGIWGDQSIIFSNQGSTDTTVGAFSCSTQLKMKFQLVIKAKMLKNSDFLYFKTQMMYLSYTSKKRFDA